jgi:hypothetical protein
MGNTAVNRKYPRADIDHPGVMTVRIPDRGLTQPVPVAIRQISCEGAGLALRATAMPLERRTMVTMNFKVEGRHFEIPGLIAWVAPAKAPHGPLDLGVRFQLALVPAATREAYARWIVSLLLKQAAQTLPPAR